MQCVQHMLPESRSSVALSLSKQTVAVLLRFKKIDLHPRTELSLHFNNLVAAKTPSIVQNNTRLILCPFRTSTDTLYE